jgi:hypothetical protein
VKQIRKRLTYANVMSSISVFLILGGATAVAATKIGANEIKANSIKTGKIVKEAVTEGKIKNAAVTTGKLANGSVTSDKLADNAVTTTKLADKAVTTAKLADKAVTGAKVDLGTLGTVPTATNATNAVNATNAQTAQTAESVATSARGVALAGVTSPGTGANPTVSTFFNRLGGAPTIVRTSAGRYTVSFPGLSANVTTNVIATGNGPNDDQVSITSSGGNLLVGVLNGAGTATDDFFSIVVFGSSSTG